MDEDKLIINHEKGDHDNKRIQECPICQNENKLDKVFGEVDELIEGAEQLRDIKDYPQNKCQLDITIQLAILMNKECPCDRCEKDR